MNDPHTYLTNELPSIADQVSNQIRRCINGRSPRASEDAIPIGVSKFCGRPDVPDHFDWPMSDGYPCWFLGQINFEECQTYDLDISLPPSGLISFFYDDAGGEPGAHSQLIMFPPKTVLKRKEVVPDTRWGSDFHAKHLYSRSLELSQGFCLPQTNALGLSTDQMDEFDLLDDIVAEFNETFSKKTHQLFGIPLDVWQTIPRGYQMVANFGDCQDNVIFLRPESEPAFNTTKLKVLYECT